MIGVSRPLIGMLCWEAGFPRGLAQLEELIGNSTNPGTFGFPVRFERVRGANIHTVVERPSPDALRAMIDAARRMEMDGIKAITTSCGFNAVFQAELANAVSVPVFTSSLLQVPMVHRMLRKERMIGIITARKASLSQKHLEQVGIGKDIPVRIEGLENTGEWDKILNAPELAIDLAKLKSEVLDVARNMVNSSKNIGAIVLECTDLPPFAKAIKYATDLPVFDIVTLVNMVYAAVTKDDF